MRFKYLKRWLFDHPLKNNVLLKETYRVERCLGAGGYGFVYLCQHTVTGEHYILKQLRPTKAKKLKEQQRFQKEIQRLKEIQHKQIPSLIDDFQEGEHLYYVMDWINGNNIEELLFFRKHAFTQLQTLQLIEQLLHVVEYLHDRHIFHSDIRTPNIIIMNGQLYLIDFGLAIQLNNSQTKERAVRQQDDFFDIGETLLFLLYSQYTGTKKRGRTWLEELTLTEELTTLLKKLLGIDALYENIATIRIDLQRAIQSIT